MENFCFCAAISHFHLNSWRKNVEETDSFRRFLGKLPETVRKLCVSTNFPYREKFFYTEGPGRGHRWIITNTATRMKQQIYSHLMKISLRENFFNQVHIQDSAKRLRRRALQQLLTAKNRLIFLQSSLS